jgi:hypothetical protein
MKITKPWKIQITEDQLQKEMFLEIPQKKQTPNS